jgi:hypothetical protein
MILALKILNKEYIRERAPDGLLAPENLNLLTVYFISLNDHASLPSSRLKLNKVSALKNIK